MSSLRDSLVATCNDAGKSKRVLGVYGMSNSSEFQYSQLGILFRDFSLSVGGLPVDLTAIVQVAERYVFIVHQDLAEMCADWFAVSGDFLRFAAEL